MKLVMRELRNIVCNYEICFLLSTMQAAFRYKDSTSVGEDTEAESERL